MNGLSSPVDRHYRQFVIAACFALAGLAFFAIMLHPSVGNDWKYGFTVAARHWRQPYIVAFHNPPWLTLVLLPLAILPEPIGLVVNGMLVVGVTAWLVRREGGSWLASLVTWLSPPFIALLFSGNIDWVSMLGLLIGGAWGTPLLVVKPQVTGLIPLLFFKRDGYRWRFWLPLMAVVLLSLLIWGWWPSQIPPLPGDPSRWNQSLFPWTAPFGLVAAWLAWKRDSLRWALLANLLLAPYFGVGSAVPAVAAWGARYPRAVGLGVALFWIAAGLVWFVV